MAANPKKDPNIANEQGHTFYPKWVKTKEGADVLVQNADEEKVVTGKAAKNDSSGWGKPQE